jgi:hypothetical protein
LLGGYIYSFVEIVRGSKKPIYFEEEEINIKI